MPLHLMSRVGTKTLGGGVISDAESLPSKIDHVVVMGASIMDGTVSTEASRLAFQAAISERLEHPVTVWDAAVSGTTTGTYMTEWPALSAAIPSSINNNRTVAYIHIGGNDVTGNRPYTSAQDATVIASMISNINWIIDRVEARGWRWILADLSFRNYDGTTAAAESQGSLPYNKRVTKVINRQRGSRYQHSDGVSWLDFYTVLFNNQAWLGPDYVHLSGVGNTGLRNYVAYVLMCVERGVVPVSLVKGDAYSLPPTPVARSVEAYDPPESKILGSALYTVRPGDVFVYSFGSTGKPVSSPNIVLQTIAYSTTSLAAIRYSDGVPLAARMLIVRSFSGGRPIDPAPNLELAPYVKSADLRSCFYVGGDTGSNNNAAIKLYGLPRGSYELTFTGMRYGSTPTEVSRTSLIAIEIGTGTTLSGQYIAGQPASGAPNHLILSGISPVNGEIQFSVNRLVQTGTIYFAYLGVLIVRRLS